jgi:hypothetical protein
VTAPTRADAERAISRALACLADADQSEDQAVKADRYRQAAQQLGHASRILAGLVPDSPPPRGMNLALPGARRPASVLPGTG